MDSVELLKIYGYCILEDRIPAEQADRMAQKYLQLHEKPETQPFISGDEHYQTLFGMMNLDEASWSCAAHPDTVAIARHFLGQGIRVVEACSKPCWPGASAGSLHVDSASNFHEVPDVPWMINTIWMLSDFTEENGATRVVPMSHRSRLKVPPADMDSGHPSVKPLNGKRGSVAMWHGGLFHTSGANWSNQIRVGLNIAYYPRWFNNWVEGGHQPIWPETYDRMPPEMQALCPGIRGKKREDVYES